MNITLTPTIQNLLTTGPDEILLWLEACKADPSKATGFHWQGLAEAAARKSKIELDLDLAAVAIQVYEYWASLMDETAYESSRLSIMSLRAYFIKYLGSEDGDSVLDIHFLVAAFEDGLIYSISEAAKLCVGWEQLDVSKIRELRRIKSRLAPFKLLPPQLLNHFPQIQEWLAIRSQLP